MKKKIYLVAMVLSLATSLVGCGKKDKETKKVSVKEDVVEFVNEELPAIKSERESAINSYNAYFETDDMEASVFLSELESAIIPNMKTYVANLEAVKVDTDEVVALKDLYVQASKKQLEAMELVATAISSENPEYLTQADALIAEAELLFTQYESQLKNLTIEHSINIEGSF